MNKTTIPAIILVLLLSITVGVCTPIHLRTGDIEPAGKDHARPDLSNGGGPAYYIVQFRGPVQDNWKAPIAGLGIKLLDYIPENAFVAKLTPKQFRAVTTLTCVQAVQRLLPEHRASQRVRIAKNTYQDVLIRLFPGESARDVEKLIRVKGGKVYPRACTDSYVRAIIPAGALSILMRHEGISWIEEWLQPRLTNRVAQGIVGVTDIRAQLGLYGEGQILAIAESGLDTGNMATLSLDFASRLLRAYALRRPGDWSDQTGHGTHITGVAAGSGELSGSNPGTHSYGTSYAGVAPEAQLVLQSIGDSSGYVYPPFELADLFQPTYDDGARIHSDSWGTPSHGEYTLYSQQVDEFLWNHKDFLVVFPTGNDGRDGNSDGKTDPGSVYAPATAKNCIAVGATESVQTAGWNTTYGAAWPADFPTAPLYGDLISNNAQGMVAWSGRGPCADGRIKPDICAPGTNIISCRTHTNSGVIGWRIFDANYIYWGGTSMSTPMVSGAATLAREHYVKNHGTQPSGALLKATLLNAAKDITPGQFNSPYPTEVPLRPNSVEGWGRLDLLAALDPAAPRVIQFVDNTSGLSTGQSAEYTYTVLGNSVPLAVTLVWTDPPGSPSSAWQLVNDLNLVVTDPLGRVYLGNGSLDDKNNVETVDVPSPATGTYTVTITGRSVPTGPQPFALVVSGELPGSYIAGTVRTASGNPISGATVTVSGEGITRSTTTGGNGKYTVHLSPGTYTVTASKTGWTFSPPSMEVIVGETAVTDRDFTGSAPSGCVSGTITRIIGGITSYQLESPHPYYDENDLVYTITAHPSAVRVRVHFSEIAVEDGYDFVTVESPEGEIIDRLTGEISDKWSGWITGNTLRVRLDPDEATTDYGFFIDGYEIDTVYQGGLAGVTVTAQPGGATAITSSGGVFTIEGLEPITYTVTPSLPNWEFHPDSKSAQVSPGATTGGVDFTASPPGSVGGRVTTGTLSEQAQVLQSQHPYSVNSKITYLLEGPPGAVQMRVHFAQMETEAGFDFVYVKDANDRVIDTFTGTYTDLWSSWVEGNTLKIVLISDESTCAYGFRTDKFEAVVDQRGVPGAVVTIQPGGQSAITDATGNFSITQVRAGFCSASVSKSYWSFDPALRQINVVSDLQTTGVDFYGCVGMMPDIAYVKSLADGEEVSLAGKITTAGTSDVSGCYIEEIDRYSGVKIATSQSVDRGKLIDVTGVMRTLQGERCIDAASVKTTGTPGTLPLPLGFRTSALGGSAMHGLIIPGVDQGSGLNNIGLLVSIWGRVTYSEMGSFYVDDGYSYNDGSEHAGVKVICGGLSSPAEGAFVRVTAVSSCESSGTGYSRALRVRGSGDILELLPASP